LEEQQNIMGSAIVEDLNIFSTLFFEQPFGAGASYRMSSKYLLNYLAPYAKLEGSTVSNVQTWGSTQLPGKKIDRNLAEKVFGSLPVDEKTLRKILNEIDDEFGLY